MSACPHCDMGDRGHRYGCPSASTTAQAVHAQSDGANAPPAPEGIGSVLGRIAKAHAMVAALCKPRGTTGARDWMMSIPARPDHDPDLVIGSALREARIVILALTSGAAAAIHDGATATPTPEGLLTSCAGMSVAEIIAERDAALAASVDLHDMYLTAIRAKEEAERERALDRAAFEDLVRNLEKALKGAKP